MVSFAIQALAALAILGALALIVWLNLYVDRAERDGHWHVHNTKQMKRWTGGRWEYRPMTEREELDWIDRRAW